MYCVSKTYTGKEIMHNDGSGWVVEPGLALEAAIAADGGAPIGITGDATHLYVWCQTTVFGGWSVYRGTFGGSWARETRSWDATGGKLEYSGKCIMSDETGAIWVFMGGGGVGAYEVHRRDPGTGVWARHHYKTGSPGSSTGMFVVNSSNIIVVAALNSSLFDGTAWYDYSGWGNGGSKGIWGRVTTEITSVTGPDGTARVSTKGGDVLQVSGVFAADTPMTAYFGENGDTTDLPCYFGPGLGYTGTSVDGETVQVIAPPHPKSTTAKVTLVVSGEELVSPAIEVVERTWPSVGFSMRRSFPPWAGVGPRRLPLEDLE
jgi:hypothetical protein